MSKIKMRCNTCGKWFQSANAKEVTCPDCMQKARRDKLAAKSSPQTPGPSEGVPNRVVPPPPPKPKAAPGSGSHWLDNLTDVKIGEPDQPTQPKLPPSQPRPPRNDFREREREAGSAPGSLREERGPGNYREGEARGPGGYRDGGQRGPGGYRDGEPRGPGGYRDGGNRSPGPYRVIGGSGLPPAGGTFGVRPRQPMESDTRWRPRPGPGVGGVGGERYPDFRKGPHEGKPLGPKSKPPRTKVATPPKPKREKIPPPAPFVPNDEQVAQVEARYLKLAVPAEFDGIRTQIATELSIPKSAVKKIIKTLRDKMSLPSWWELQTYKGPQEELDKIKERYVPFLPLPPVGVHKQIAEDIGIKPTDVYQAIKAIRQEMNLPQFNDPSLHGLELKPKSKAEEQSQEQEPAQAETENLAAQDAEVVEHEQERVDLDVALVEAVQESAILAPVEHAQPAMENDSPPASQPDKQEEVEQEQVVSIETDTTFHREGDTLEATAPPSEDDSTLPAGGSAASEAS